jgi:bacteriorhodopsin
MSTIQLVGAAVFVLAGIAFLAQGARTDVLRAAGASAVAALVAGGAYAGMHVGVGDELHYLAWFAITAAILFQLWWLADADADAVWLAVMLVADLLAVGAAYVADVAVTPAAETSAGAASEAVAGAVGSDLATVAAAAVLLLVPLAVLFSRVSSAAGTLSYDVAAHFSVLRNVAVLVFVGYAVAWLLGALVLGGRLLELVYLVVDLLAGVGFGLLLVRDPSLLRG